MPCSSRNLTSRLALASRGLVSAPAACLTCIHSQHHHPLSQLVAAPQQLDKRLEMLNNTYTQRITSYIPTYLHSSSLEVQLLHNQ